MDTPTTPPIDLGAIEARLNSSINHRAQLAEDAHALLAEVRRLTDALATAHLDGARVMRERCIIVCENVGGEADADGESGRALAAHHIAQRISNLTLDPAAVPKEPR